MAYPLPTIPFLRLRFALEAQRACSLPPYKGSLLRGAFGHALRRGACVAPKGTRCDGCPFRAGCAYAKLFEFEPLRHARDFVAGRPTRPRPYVFEPRDGQRSFRPGDRLSFDLLLFGHAIELQAFAWCAVASMARRGLGSGRHPFALVEAHYQDEKSAWHPFGDPRAAGFQLAPGVIPSSSSRVGETGVLEFVTPLRVVVDGKPREDFSFRTVVYKSLRRVLELAHFYGPEQEIDWQDTHLIDLADQIAIYDRDVRWYEVHRYSHRQKMKMKLGGVVGTWKLEGPLTELIPLLQLAEIVHVGKATTFGLGQVSLTS